MSNYNARKDSRFIINLEVFINGSILGHALDISENGMFIHTHVQFVSGKQITLDFRLAEGEPNLSINAVVRHAKPGVGIGIRFVNPLPEEIARIRRFVINGGQATTDTRIKVLIVNESPLVRRMFRGSMVLQGYDVLEAGDGREALKLIGEEQPDLVLLDPALKVMDGFQLLKAIRSDEKTKNLKVVVLATVMTPELHVKVAPYGVLDVIAKITTSPKKLAEMIPVYLSR